MSQETIKTVLNVGAGKKGVFLPPWFDDWQHVRLDIDPGVSPDILIDAREIGSLPGRYDAVYCSHNLEHYSPHDASVVVRGMRRVLKPDGFADILVPDVGSLLQQAGPNGWDLDTFLYQSTGGPILVRDILYGYERQIEYAEHPEYMMHKNAFSARTLSMLLSWCGFAHVFLASMNLDLRGVGFNAEPSDEVLAGIGLARE